MLGELHTFCNEFIMNLRQTFSLALALVLLCAFVSTSAAQQQRQRRATTRPTPTKQGATQPQTSSPPVEVRVTAAPPPPPARPTPTPEAATVDAIEDDGDVISVVSKLVVVPVAVSDASGNPVQGLIANDFRIEEKGKPQQIAQIGTADEVPLELAMLIDVSGSVLGRFDFEREAAGRFLRQIMKPADRVTLFAIDTTPQRIVARATLDEALKQLNLIQPRREATAFFDTVVEAADFLASETPPRSRRVIVCLSDGEDTYSERMKIRIAREVRTQDKKLAANAALNMQAIQQTQAQTHAALLRATLPDVQRADAVFYSINPSGNSIYLNVGARRGQEGMQEISRVTGGASFLPNVLEDLDAVFNQIAAELRAQYLLQYYSNNKADSGEYLPITVRMSNRPNLRVRARQGYYSSK